MLPPTPSCAEAFASENAWAPLATQPLELPQLPWLESAVPWLLAAPAALVTGIIVGLTPFFFFAPLWAIFMLLAVALSIRYAMRLRRQC